MASGPRQCVALSGLEQASVRVHPGEGGQGEDAQEQFDGIEEQQDGVEDGLQPQGVGLQQQVIGCHHRCRECQGQADGERHLPLAQVPFGAKKYPGDFNAEIEEEHDQIQG